MARVVSKALARAHNIAYKPNAQQVVEGVGYLKIREHSL